MDSGKEILRKLKDIKPVLERDFSVKEIGLFGSFSNNTFSDSSDIDLLVELKNPIGWRIFTLEIYLEKIFNKKIDLVTKNAIKDQLRDQILNQVIYA